MVRDHIPLFYNGYVYPWEKMVSVGDYILVDMRYRPYGMVKAAVSGRNIRYRGTYKWEAIQVAQGTMIVLRRKYNIIDGPGRFCGEVPNVKS